MSARHRAESEESVLPLAQALMGAGVGEVVLHETAAGPGLTLRPLTTRDVSRAVVLASRAGLRVAVTRRFGPGLLAFDLSRMSRVDPPDERSSLIRVEAGARLNAVEERAIQAGLTLGPLLPSSPWKAVGAWLAGPTRGERAIPGDRLETAALALEAVLPDGSTYVSKEAPRSATGPDLDYLLLGGEGRFGIITRATLRLFPRALAEALGSRGAVGAVEAIEAVREAMRQGLAPAEARWERGRAAVEARFTGSFAGQRARRFGSGPIAGREIRGHLELAGSWRAWSAVSPLRPEAIQLVAIHGDGAFGALRFEDPEEAARAADHARAIGFAVVSPRALRVTADAGAAAAGAGSILQRLFRETDAKGLFTFHR